MSAASSPAARSSAAAALSGSLPSARAAKRGRDRAALEKARSDYLKKREKIAWARLKEGITRRGGTQKAYRALKQTNIDPEKALRKLKRLPENLSTYGASRLRDALST